MKKIINLNPSVIESNKNNNRTNKLMIRIGLLLVAILFVISFPLNYINRLFDDDIEKITNELYRHSEAISYNSTLKKEKAELDRFIKSITTISDSKKNISKTVEAINKHIPQNMKFLEFSLDENGLIKIQGEANSYDSIPEFIANLEMSKNFENVLLEEIVAKKNNVVVGSKPIVNIEDVKENINEVKISYDFTILIKEVNTDE